MSKHSANKHKLSKTVLEMKFMKKTKIQQEKNDAETENLDVLTDQKIKGGQHCNYIIERNWEFIEGLKCSRFNYGMSQKPVTTEAPVPVGADDEEETDEPAPKKTKHRRFNN